MNRAGVVETGLNGNGAGGWGVVKRLYMEPIDECMPGSGLVGMLSCTANRCVGARE